MNKTELVEAIASSTEMTKTDVDKVVTAFVDVVTEALVKGDKVSLKGFGNFEVRERAASNLKSLKDIQHKAKRAKEFVSDDGITTLLNLAVQSKDGYPIIIGRTEVKDGGQLRNLWDVVRSRMSTPGALVVAGEKDGKPLLMAAGSDEAVSAGFNAGAVIKAIAPHVKGGGGGKPTMAQAGGKDVAGIDNALAAAREMLVG